MLPGPAANYLDLPALIGSPFTNLVRTAAAGDGSPAKPGARAGVGEPKLHATSLRLCADRVPDLLAQPARSLTSAVRAAKEMLKDLDAVSDDPAVAVLTRGRQFLDRALERVEGVALAGYGAYLERHRIVITAQVNLPLLQTGPNMCSRQYERRPPRWFDLMCVSIRYRGTAPGHQSCPVRWTRRCASVAT